jgi:4-hydroxybenzoate polyprenyltransferase
MKDFMKHIFQMSRPRFWLYLLGPYMLGVLAAIERPEALSDPLILAFAFFFTFPANVLVYGVNDMFDTDTDTINEKKQGYESALKRDQRSRTGRAILLINLPFVLASLFVGNAASWALVGFYAFSVFYSAPPIRAKAVPFLDSAFNVLYVFPALFGYFLAGGTVLSPMILIGAWCWVMAMHAYSAIPDIEADKRAGITTIAVYLGKHKTLLFCTFMFATAALLSLPTLGWPAIPLGIIYLVMMFASHKADAMMPLYKLFPLINGAVGMVMFWLLAVPLLF